MLDCRSLSFPDPGPTNCGPTNCHSMRGASNPAAWEYARNQERRSLGGVHKMPTEQPLPRDRLERE
jgi:hypothetical protein